MLASACLRRSGAAAVIGWGARPSAVHGRALARRLALPYLGLEDGFLRSLGLGSEGAGPYALILDDRVPYFDARAVSRLEQILNGEPVAPLPLVPDERADGRSAGSGLRTDDLDDPRLLQRARDCSAAIVASRLSKYNAAPVRRLPPTRRPRVLVVDQCRGDASIPGALADAACFAQMLAAARAEHPRAEILVKEHPAVLVRRARGHFSAADIGGRTQWLSEPWNPIALLQQVDQVYVVSSLLGLEALLVGVPVTCFGMPFYAGWGLTDDRLEAPRPRRALRLEQLFAAAYLIHSHYLDPDSGEPCSAERVIEHLALQRQLFAVNARSLIAYRFPLWKRRHLRRFLRSPGHQVAFVSRIRALDRLDVGAVGGVGATSPKPSVLVWGARGPKRLLVRAEQLGLDIWRVEDGFLRSAGLGSDLRAPLSLVFDRQGIYFDPRHPSDLEQILARACLSAAELARARALRAALIRARLSKYNVGDRRHVLDLSAAEGRRIILVPGQVPGDASLRLGCGGLDPGCRQGLDANADLLARVRREQPDAYILYKPHPDLVRGNRRGDRCAIDPGDYDRAVTEVGIVPCLEAADEVHSLTSLVGFEALLRGLTVHTYCWPFYAGWGLTIDHEPLAARARSLTLDELVAGVLLRYPRYLNPATGEFTSPEQAIGILTRELDRAAPATRGRLVWRPLRLAPAFIAACWRESQWALQGYLSALGAASRRLG
jgi:capsular polysaccharide export protein